MFSNREFMIRLGKITVVIFVAVLLVGMVWSSIAMVRSQRWIMNIPEDDLMNVTIPPRNPPQRIVLPPLLLTPTPLPQ